MYFFILNHLCIDIFSGTYAPAIEVKMVKSSGIVFPDENVKDDAAGDLDWIKSSKSSISLQSSALKSKKSFNFTFVYMEILAQDDFVWMFLTVCSFIICVTLLKLSLNWLCNYNGQYV